MPHSCRDIVTRALHMARIIDREEDPSAAELRDGMYVLQSLYDQWLVGGMFGRLTDIYEDGDYEASEGQRIFLDSGTVTLPTEIDPDSGEGRKPRDLVAIETNDPTNGRQAWIWDRTEWVRIDNLAEGDTAPLSARGMNGLAACVAMLYAEEFGGELTTSMLRQSAAFKTALSYKMGSNRDVVAGVWF